MISASLKSTAEKMSRQPEAAGINLLMQEALKNSYTRESDVRQLYLQLMILTRIINKTNN